MGSRTSEGPDGPAGVDYRRLRSRDAESLAGFLLAHFPEEERWLGHRPSVVADVVRQVQRWDRRILLGAARRFGRPVYDFFVAEAAGTLVGTTLLTYGPTSGFVSLVAVDPRWRRQGVATRLLGLAHAAARRARRRYVALDVLESNAPARGLYERLGYRPLRPVTLFAGRPPGRSAGTDPPDAESGGVRAFRPEDRGPLLRVAERGTPPEVEPVLPAAAYAIGGSPRADRVLRSVSRAWTVDGSDGPAAYVRATASEALTAGHLGLLVGPEALKERIDRAIHSAVRWLGTHGSSRVVAEVPGYAADARAALEREGFRPALELRTMYRPLEPL